MVDVSESDIPATRLGDVQKLLRGLSKQTVLVFEDGNYNQSFGEGVDLCTHVSIGPNGKRTFIMESEINEVKEDGNEVFKLEEPVIRLKICLGSTP